MGELSHKEMLGLGWFDGAAVLDHDSVSAVGGEKQGRFRVVYLDEGGG